MAREELVRQQLAALRGQGLLRRMREIDGAQDRVVRVDGSDVVNFSSNNYLGLASRPELAQAASDAASMGTGAGASRLIVGNLAGHRELERALAQWLERPAALVFNSGYHANVGVLQALVGRGDAVFSDELNHASIIDGCRLSRATVCVYRHRDVDALARMLARTPARRRVIVTDSVFSMDGDIAPLRALRALADEHDAWLMVDEAHAVGAMGPGGRGAAAAQQVCPDVVVGTLGKAFGSFGAFAAGSAELVELLVNRARSFVFTTALPPTVTAASLAALGLVAGAHGDRARDDLAKNIDVLHKGLTRIDCAPQHAEITHVSPILARSAADAMECAERLLAAGFYAQGIRPPTVPEGSSRLRVALMATHTKQDIDGLVRELAVLAREGKLRAHGD